MKKTSSLVRTLVRSTRGANMVEYIILVGVVALMCIAGYTAFGNKIRDKIGTQGKTVSEVNTGIGTVQ